MTVQAEREFDLKNAFASHYTTWRFVMEEYCPGVTELRAAAIGASPTISKHVFLDFVCRLVMAIVRQDSGFDPDRVATFVRESAYFDKLLVRYGVFRPEDFTRLCKRASASWSKDGCFKYERYFELDIEKGVYGSCSARALTDRLSRGSAWMEIRRKVESDAVKVRDAMVEKARLAAGMPAL